MHHGLSGAMSEMYPVWRDDAATYPSQHYMRIITDQWSSTPIEIHRDSYITCRDVVKGLSKYLKESVIADAGLVGTVPTGFRAPLPERSLVTMIQEPRSMRLTSEGTPFFGVMTLVRDMVPLTYHLSFTETPSRA